VVGENFVNAGSGFPFGDLGNVHRSAPLSLRGRIRFMVLQNMY
jgi:hypothetical protein